MNALHNFNFFLFEYANLCEQIDHLLMTALGPVLNAPNVFCLHHPGEI